jgi:putative redox protein
MKNYFENNITGNIGTQKYLCKIQWRNGSIIMDEPNDIGGRDLGPDPHSLMLASLAGCTLSTLRMYIDRKEWTIPEITICMNLILHNDEVFSTEIKREIQFSNAISEEQKQRLLVIANKCPISKILENKITINTKI